MTNYILSIDPSTKNTGFTLWQSYFKKCDDEICTGDNCYSFASKRKDLRCIYWKPIWVTNYRFDRYDDKKFLNNIKWPIRDILDGVIDKPNWLDNLTLYIERGFQGFRGSETLDHLRGNIFGLFNKYLSKDKLVSPKEWQNWYKSKYWLNNLYEWTDLLENSNGKWDKKISLSLAKWLININKWNIDINNDNDIADSLLIGWYVINVK